MNRIAPSVLVCAMLIAMPRTILALEYLPPMKWQEPPVVTPGATDNEAPSDAVVLFDGTDLSAWNNGENWTVADGVATVGKGAISTKEAFGDCQLHIEWSAPTLVTSEGQGRGNSGVFLMGKYEVQVLDSFQNSTYPEGQAGAVYKQTPPMVNAMRPPGEWNTYDIFWTCPRFKEGKVIPATVTVVHNGVLVVLNHQLAGDTPFNRPPAYYDFPEKGPILLQDHGNPVRYRNIWVREIAPPVGEPREAKYREGDKTWPAKKGPSAGSPAPRSH